jgi:hypothetical protein
MCRTDGREEVANSLDTLADLFAWKRRKGPAQAAAVARRPSRGWRHDPEDEPAPYPPPLRDPRSA